MTPTLTAPQIIGLAGYARSGKDTVATIIARQFGHSVLSFSDILREFLYAQELYVRDEKGFAIPLNEVVDAIGWEDARDKFPYIRLLQQRSGTEAGREIISDTIWLDAWTRRTQDLGGAWVNPSVRFLNEAARIRELGGKIYRVVRPGVGAVNAHVSDTALDGYYFDGVIHNDGSLLDLEVEVEQVLAGERV